MSLTIIATSAPTTPRYPLPHKFWSNITFNGTPGLLIFLHMGMCGCTKAARKSQVMGSPVSQKLVRGKTDTGLIYRPTVRLLRWVKYQTELKWTFIHHRKGNNWKCQDPSGEYCLLQWQRVVGIECWESLMAWIDNVTRVKVIERHNVQDVGFLYTGWTA